MRAPALEVDDPAHGYHFSLPDDFVRDSKPKDPDVVDAYKRPSKSSGEASTYVEVTALHSPVLVDERVDPSKIPAESGFNISFDEIEWQTHKLDVIISTPQDPARAHIRVYSTSFPLSGQAVRLSVAGPASGENAARALFDKTVASLTNTKPLAIKKSEAQGMARGFGMLIGGAIVFFILRAGSTRKAKDKKLKKELQRLQQQPPRPPGIRRP